MNLYVIKAVFSLKLIVLLVLVCSNAIDITPTYLLVIFVFAASIDVIKDFK
jgi:hypothetical protein